VCVGVVLGVADGTACAVPLPSLAVVTAAAAAAKKVDLWVCALLVGHCQRPL
jgi:hypothetical protein